MTSVSWLHSRKTERRAVLCFTYELPLPEGASEENLLIALWDEEASEGAGGWNTLEGGVVDKATHTICAPVSHFNSFAIMSYTRPATFVTSNLTITPATVEIGEETAIGVLIVNTGDLTGSYELILRIDNVVIVTEDVDLAGGTNQRVTFTTSNDIPGTYTIEVNGLLGTFTAKAPPVPVLPRPTASTRPAAFTTSGLIVSPTEIDIGESVTISVIVTNIGDLTDSYDVILKIDDAAVATKGIIRAGGNSKTVTFTVSEDEARSYEVEISGQNGEFTVLSPRSAISWPLIGGVIAAVAMIGLAIVLLVMQRKRNQQV